MKKTAILLLALIFVWATVADAENFAAVKYGHVIYAQEADSAWEGSHLYYPADAFGIMIGTENNRWIARLDASRERTGVEFQHNLGVAYDGVRINMMPVTIQFGRRFGDKARTSAYLLAGAGIMINKADIWKYKPTPFEGRMDNSPCAVATLGIEKQLTKHLYAFAEGRYLYSKARVEISGYNSFTEDISSTSVWGGLGWKW